MNNYTEILREHQLKATPQRIEIANTLNNEGHVNIDDLYAKLKKKFDSISLATIYKNINIMMDASFIQEVKIPHQKSVYELSKTQHSHLVCKHCGKVEDLTVDLSSLQHDAQVKAHFQIEKADLVFSGLCQECQ